VWKQAAAMDPLVSTDWLAARLEEPRLRIVDCRFRLGVPAAGRELYSAGHIPGAQFLDLDEDLADPPGPTAAAAAGTGAAAPDAAAGPVGGRHPLPDPARFAAAVRHAGIGAGTTVVAYDDAMTGGAARLWWLLRHHGFDQVCVLDGGLAAWTGPLRAGAEPAPAPGDFQPAETPRDDLVTAADLLADLDRPAAERRYAVLDARAPERFRGEQEPLDPVAGHIPGARNVPLGDAFPPPADLPRPGERTLVASCGSGVTATALLLALAAAGREDAKLYAGSWSDWVARGLPVARGEDTTGTAG
jgi:thiosulfate/3-mercaptopyruvate sulfurtransferase